MASSTVLNSLKEIVNDIIDSNGNMRVTPIGVVGKRGLDAQRIGLLEDLVILLKTTNVINAETRLYIFNRYITLGGVTETLNSEREEGNYVNVNTTKAKIWYDKGKLDKLFGPSYVADIVFSTAISTDELAEKLSNVYIKYSGDTSKMRDSIRLDIRRDIIVKSIADDEFSDFITTIAPYTSTQMQYIESHISDKQVGYFNHLLSGMGLTVKDRENLGILKELLE